MAHFFLLLNGISLDEFTHFRLSIHPLEDSLVADNVDSYKASCYRGSYVLVEQNFLNQLGKYLEVQLLDGIVRVCLAL